jgi:hypothetical protein
MTRTGTQTLAIICRIKYLNFNQNKIKTVMATFEASTPLDTILDKCVGEVWPLFDLGNEENNY